MDLQSNKLHGRADRWDPARAVSRRPGVNLYKRHGLSSRTFYKCEAKYGRVHVSEVRRLKALKDRSGKLKRIVAGAMLENLPLRDVLGTNGGGVSLSEGYCPSAVKVWDRRA